MAMEQPVVPSGPRRNFTYRCGGRTLLREQLTGRFQDGRDDLFFADWFRGDRNPCLRCSHLCTVTDNRRVDSRLHGERLGGMAMSSDLRVVQLGENIGARVDGVRLGELDADTGAAINQ